MDKKDAMASLLSKSRPAWLLMKLPCLLGLALLAGWPFRDVSPDAAAQVKGGTTLRVDVDLVTVDVIILDRKGTPVRNLKKEDFRLFEDGKEQEISTFDEVTANPGQAVPAGLADNNDSGPNRGKVVLILFDDSHLSVGQYKLTRDSAEKYVKEHMRPQDLFAVASFNLSLKVVQNFTHDGAKVLGAIRQMAGSAESAEAVTSSKSSALARDSQRMGRPAPEAPNNTLALYQAATYKAAPLLRTLDSLSSSLAQVKGRKAIVLYSEEFSASASIHNDYMKAVNSARMADVAFYTIDARGLDSLDGAGSGLTGGPQTRAVAGNTRARSSAGIDYAQFDRQPMDAILRPLARETGGLAIYNTSDFNQQLDEVDQELSNYYVLGFQSNNPKRDGKFHELDVKANVKGASIKHRNGYLDLGPMDVLAGSKEEKSLINALASPSAATQLTVTIRAAYFYDSPNLARIPVSAKISTSSIEINKKGAQLGGDLKIMGAAYVEDGSVSARFSETQHIVFDKEAEGAFRNMNLVYRNYFKLRPGQYRVKLAIADDKSRFGAAEQSLIIPPMPESGLAASSLIVADRVSRLPDLIQNLQAELLEETDPLIFNGLQVVPSVENQVPVDTPVLVFFKIYNLNASSEQRRFLARVKLLDEKGERLALPPISLDQSLVPTGKTEAVVAMNLPFEKVTAGKYKLVIEAADTASNQSVTLQTDLQLK